MRKHYVFALIILFLLALATGAVAAQVREAEEKTFTLTEKGSVSVENVVGNILIYAWEEEKVKMIATKSAKAFTKNRAEELIEAIEIEISAKEDKIDINTEFPWWDRLDPTSSVRVDYELWVPLSAEVQAESVSGNIEIIERNNDVWAKSVSGTIGIERILGDTEARTTSGAIKITKVEGDSIIADSTSGKVTLQEATGIIEAQSVSGRVKISDSKGSVESVRAVSGSIWVELTEITEYPPDMVLTSVSGDITLLLPENISAEIDAKTTSGRISSEFNILVGGEIENRRVRGTIGEGGIQITLKTTSGDISIEKA